MNKSLDERVLPDGEYIDALNIRIGSTENNSVGAIENSLGNTKISSILYEGDPLSTDARCIGAYEDNQHETIYWFVTDPGNVDMVLSYNDRTSTLIYHVISTTVLNFDTQYLVNGIDLIDGLLFWTDNYNPPRRINVNSSYAYPTMGVDNITEDDISVIVAPPLESPSVVPLISSTEKNYIIDKFVSFSYRYKYKDGEYSALSQFSDIAFVPDNFFVDFTSYTNGAMQNIFNSYNVFFNTGNKNVIQVDLCFKLSDSSIVNIIERYNKNEQGWGDDQIKSINFNNKKIYTALSSSELTRLFDNVPRIAKSQTTMGNRLMYGNYVDGYDIDTNINYDVVGVSEGIGGKYLNVFTDDGFYTINPLVPATIPSGIIKIDFTDTEIKTGALLSIQFRLFHYSFSGDPSYALEGILNEFDFSFNFNITNDFSSAYQLSQDQSFINAIYEHNPIVDCGTGFSLTDKFNCSMTTVVTSPPDWDIEGTGISAVDQGFTIIASPTEPNIIKLQIPAIKFVTDPPDLEAYEYLTDIGTVASLSTLENKRSLHSNRDYEVAIVYQDEYLRSSTALVCDDNTVFFPASASDTKNYIVSTIQNLAPSWAKRYKFVVKPSKSKYETIYTNLFFQDDDGFVWFKLEAENISKAKIGEQLTVKRDSNGAMNNLVTVTVLDVKSQSDNFISGPNPDDIVYEPAGVYMKMRVTNFEVIYDKNSFIQLKVVGGFNGKDYTQRRIDLSYANPSYDPSIPIDAENQPRITYDIPAGSIVKFDIRMNRDEANFLDANCGSRNYKYIRTVVANQDYDNLYLLAQGEGINFEDGVVSGNDDTMNTNDYNQILGVFAPCYRTSIGSPYICGDDPHPPFNPVAGYLYFIPPYWTAPPYNDPGVNRFMFQRVDPEDPYDESLVGGYYLVLQTGTPMCIGTFGLDKQGSYVDGNITIQKATSLIVFETEALDADGEIYYEGSDSFPIDQNRFHMSGDSPADQDQTSSTDPDGFGVVTINSFDCFSFGNGVESYKINDSIVGDPFYLGSRVTAVAQEQYKEAHRYASITYSGIYNAETNINKLNEFNLSLANFKDLEKSFGPINRLYARRTDVLVLQEDKISYILAGKNLLSDSAGGGQIASIPEVLGTQIARIEDYGISNNPESFSVFGGEVYFTDIKRNSVLNLRGGSAQSDALSVVSDMGMKYWFRDEFKNSPNYFKIGGYDPYMDEYVLHLTETAMPTETDIFGCGITVSKQNVNGFYEFNVEVGDQIGEITIDLSLFSGETHIIANYNDVDVVDEILTIQDNYSFTFEKLLVFPNTVNIKLTSINASFEIKTSCVNVIDYINVYRVVYNNPGLEEQTIHNQYRWSLGTYNSPFLNDFIIMEADGVSLYDSQFGGLSQGMIPADGSDITLVSQKRAGDTFVFDPDLNSFKYLVSNNLYTPSELLPLLSTITPITGEYRATINSVALAGYDYLYLVWDYRSISSITLCYDETNPYVLCCDCPVSDSYFIDSDSFITATSIWTDENQTTVADDGFYMIDDTYRQLLLGVLLDPVPCTGCVTQTLCFIGLWEEGDPEHPDGGTITYVNPAGETITQDLIWQGNFVSIEFIDIISYVGIYEISCNTQTICYEGIWEEGDPAHPEGGSVNYINADGDNITQDLIWLGDTITIQYLEIISFVGIEEVVCNMILSSRSNTGLPYSERDNGCEEILDDNVYIISNAGTDIIESGDIVCNSTNPNDRFDGGDLYYLLNKQASLPGYDYVCQINENGVITVYILCPLPPP
jgi:hypothetical protein